MKRTAIFFVNWIIFFGSPIWVAPYIWYMALTNEDGKGWKTGKKFIFD